LRRYIGGTLFIGLGGYIIWRAILLILGLFSSPVAELSWHTTCYIFVLYVLVCACVNRSGDSYSQTGYDVNDVHPTEGNPLGNPPYPGYTTAGGPNWVSPR
jgi:hypothetical protein